VAKVLQAISVMLVEFDLITTLATDVANSTATNRSCNSLRAA